MLLRKKDSCVILVDVQEKLAPFVIDSEKTIARCKWVLQLAEQLRVPIKVTEQYPRGLGQTVPALQGFARADEKVHFSCWPDKGIQHELQALGKKQLVLIGIEAHVCVLQSAFDLKEAGFDVFVVVDAISSRAEHDKHIALTRMQHSGINLITGEMVFFEWVHQAGTPEFKALSKQFLKENG